MSAKQQKPLTTLAIMLALATTSTSIAANSTARPVWAQSSSGASFAIPKELPPGKSLQIDGSTSMINVNEALKKNFEAQYPGTDIKLSYQGIEPALQALQERKIDLAAIGRPLTEEEKAAGLVAVPVTRNKIAIIVGKDNPFNKSITAQQFAKIYRGEISDWSEIGGEPGKIRVIDRPDNSEIRQAFPTYSMFQGNGLTISPNNQKIAEDSTEAVIENLGKDGISYAISNQVVNNPNVRMVLMHDLLPDSPRYPFSQPLFYIYNKSNISPAVIAFLGNARSPQNQQLIDQAKVSVAIASVNISRTATPPGGSSTPAAQPDATTGAVANDDSKSGIPSWLWWLLLPILGALLWWFLKDRGGEDATPVVVPPVVPAKTPAVDESRLILAPTNSQNIYAYWEIPPEKRAEFQKSADKNLKLRLYDTSGGIDLDKQQVDSVWEYEWDGESTDLHIPIPDSDCDYVAELGYIANDRKWQKIARSLPIQIKSQIKDTAIPAAEIELADPLIEEEISDTPVIKENQLTLVPKTSQDVYASWEISPEKHAELQEIGGNKLVLLLYEITGDIDLDHQLIDPVQQYECDPNNTDLNIQVPESDRDYIAEIGYVTDYGQWLKIARSSPVRITTNTNPSI